MEGVDLKKYRIKWAVERPDDYLMAEGYEELYTGETLTFYGCPGPAYYIQYMAGHWKNVQEVID